MTRIIAGSAGGRRLQTPRGQATRPTSDRVREALFSAIEAWAGSLSGLRVLDLYAGTGAVGLEALSRGAAAATLVEHDRSTAALIARNARDLAFDHARVVTGAVGTFLAGVGEPYDLVFMDPPYPLADEVVDGDLAALVSGGWLALDALVVVERPGKRSRVTWPEGLGEWRTKKYGESALWYGRATGDE